MKTKVARNYFDEILTLYSEIITLQFLVDNYSSLLYAFHVMEMTKDTVCTNDLYKFQQWHFPDKQHIFK